MWTTIAGGQGTTTELTIPSKTYPAGRHAWVYTPAGYPTSCGTGCDFILVFDGAMYLEAMPLPQILDSLIAARKLAPAVALLFDNGAPPGRLEDLANSHKFSAFVANELIPWARTHYTMTRDPMRSLITGSSAGGLGAAYIALEHPELFGKVFSQSGAFWRGNEASNAPPFEWTTSRVTSGAKVNVQFMLDVGSAESAGALGGTAPSLLEANRHLRDALLAKGYRLTYFEVPGGIHSPDTWGKRLPAGLVT
ncbi:MAG TPA: alpha/beta hydrolase-fold protein, partial [Gemmatimonadaceae bacterium]